MSCFKCSAIFQSTPPVKAATERLPSSQSTVIVSIHAAREGGDPCQPPFGFRFRISIHAAREGGD